MQVDMQNKEDVRTNLPCRIALQKIDCLENSLGDIKNVSFYTMIYLSMLNIGN